MRPSAGSAAADVITVASIAGEAPFQMTAETPLRVNIVSIYFHPDMSGTSQILTDLAVGLSKMGCQVSVYTTHPTFGSRSRAKRREIYNGVEIHRLFGTQFDKNHKIGRAINSATFLASAFWTMLTRRVEGPFLIVSHPPFLEFAGYLVSRLRRRRYVYLVHDVFPDEAITLGFINPNGLVRKAWDRANTLSVSHAAQVIVLSESMKAVMMKKGGHRSEAQRFHVIHNWVDEAFIRPLAKSENWFVTRHGLDNTFVVLYSGNLGQSHDLETMIAAAERLRERDMTFLFIGDGGKKQKLEALVQERGLRNVRFLPYQPRDVLPFSLTCSDVSLMALEKGIEGLQMPSKLYAILASGRPVVALVEAGFEIARLIDGAGCGRSVPPNDVEGLCRALEFYYADRSACDRAGRLGRQYLEAHFSRARALREYYDVLRSVPRM